MPSLGHSSHPKVTSSLRAKPDGCRPPNFRFQSLAFAPAQLPNLEHPLSSPLLSPSGFSWTSLFTPQRLPESLLHARRCARISFSAASFNSDVFSFVI